MIAMGTAGMASIPAEAFIATLIPLIIGIVWGNLDETFRELAEKSLPIITFFMMIPIGAGMSLASLAEGGFAGILLAILSAMSAFVFYFLFNCVSQKTDEMLWEQQLEQRRQMQQVYQHQLRRWIQLGNHMQVLQQLNVR